MVNGRTEDSGNGKQRVTFVDWCDISEEGPMGPAADIPSDCGLKEWHLKDSSARSDQRPPRPRPVWRYVGVRGVRMSSGSVLDCLRRHEKYHPNPTSNINNPSFDIASKKNYSPSKSHPPFQKICVSLSLPSSRILSANLPSLSSFSTSSQPPMLFPETIIFCPPPLLALARNRTHPGENLPAQFPSP